MKALLPILLAGFVLSACSTYDALYRPAEYRPVTEVPAGPGMFTGESGTYRLWGGDDPTAAETPDEETVDSSSGPVVVKKRRGR